MFFLLAQIVLLLLCCQYLNTCLSSVFFFFSDCATDCLTCKLKGVNKCDTNGCSQNKGVISDFTICQGKFG